VTVVSPRTTHLRAGKGDEVILSVMEHHANLVPWQMVAEKTGATLKFVQMDENESYDMNHFRERETPN
jgi:cysteine desulfurase/selenocysteine lyase